jgi:putative transposase
MRRPYPTDLSDAEWNYIEPHMPKPKGHGRPRIHTLREILDAIFYVLRSGCQWAYSRTTFLDGPPFSTTSEPGALTVLGRVSIELSGNAYEFA